MAARTPGRGKAEAVARLTEALDGSPIPGFESLTAPQLTRLADAVDAARRRHADDLRQGTATALGHVPKLLRGPVRRIVGM
jgi:hypothetical protein